jgi:prepilin-type N-terminal cleavage/methylation domain-containing protein
MIPARTHRIAGLCRRGFTLVEMLLAAGLCSVLLLALWGLYSTYAELFEKRQTRVEQSQLSRALLQQLVDDLHSAIQDPIPGRETPAPGGTPLRRFSFFGSAHELRLDVLQAALPPGGAVPTGDKQAAADGTAAPRVPELRTVYYSFTPPVAADPGQPAQGGLTRRELDFETPAVVGPARDGPRATADLALAAGTALGEPGGSAFDAPADDPQVTAVPEVSALDFRYYDGSGWTSEWNSIQRKSLPVAVEVVLRIAALPTGERRASEPPAEAESPEELGQPTPAPAAPRARPTTERRLIVDLPGSPSYRQTKPPPPSKASPPVFATPAIVEVPRIALSRWTPPAEPRRLPEEWLRTRSP